MVHSSIRAAARRFHRQDAGSFVYATTPILIIRLASPEYGRAVVDSSQPKPQHAMRFVHSVRSGSADPSGRDSRTMPPLRRMPREAVPQHGPAADDQPSGNRDDGNLLPGGTSSTDLLVDGPHPRVVLQPNPTHFNEQRTQQRVSLAADSSLTITVARLVLPGAQAYVGGDLLAILEPLRIADHCHHDFGQPRSHSRDRSQ